MRKINLQKIVGNLLGKLRKLYMDGAVIVSLPQAIENSRQFQFLRTDISQKTQSFGTPESSFPGVQIIKHKESRSLYVLINVHCLIQGYGTASGNVASMRKPLDGSLWWYWIAANAAKKNGASFKNYHRLSHPFCFCGVQIRQSLLCNMRDWSQG